MNNATYKEPAEAEVRAALLRDGFDQIYARTDPPGKKYAEHEHPVPMAHVILAGSMTTWQGEREYHLAPGDRLDLAKRVKHRAIIGPAGCTYMIGIRL